jgi:hypothetical protein
MFQLPHVELISNMVSNVTIIEQNNYIFFSIASKKLKSYD